MKKLFLLLVIISTGMTQTYAIVLTQAEKDSIVVNLKSIQNNSRLLRMQFDSLSNDVDSLMTSTTGVKKSISDLEEKIDSLWIGPFIMIVLTLFLVIFWVYIFRKNISKKKANI